MKSLERPRAPLRCRGASSRRRSRLLLHIALVALASPAAAQEWPSRVMVSANGGAAPAGHRVSDELVIRPFGDPETGTASVEYPPTAGPLVDGGVMFRVWRRFGAGVTVSYATAKIDATIEASLPHPFFLNTFRNISGETAVSRRETAANIQASCLLPVSAHVLVLFSGGPSIVHVSQPVVGQVQYSQTYPYDTATFTGAVTPLGSATAVGFNAGGDVMWMFRRSVGVGGMARYTRATVTLDAGSGLTLRVRAGGPQVGAGIRLWF